jgi:hypothetical protein
MMMISPFGPVGYGRSFRRGGEIPNYIQTHATFTLHRGSLAIHFDKIQVEVAFQNGLRLTVDFFRES